MSILYCLSHDSADFWPGLAWEPLGLGARNAVSKGGSPPGGTPYMGHFRLAEGRGCSPEDQLAPASSIVLVANSLCQITCRE